MQTILRVFIGCFLAIATIILLWNAFLIGFEKVEKAKYSVCDGDYCTKSAEYLQLLHNSNGEYYVKD